ncbi:DUF308 domain-containing protein [Candidatus Saccharibacteria bacterium]|nr:DUF308 domain-containing protein [Candidatus Saccharibacteria bacterium]MBR0372518.1 DUF308 domain-containing protein [Candidatus Saccharibacteria bacterium]
MSKVDIIKHPVEKIGSDLKKYAWSAIFESLITMVMGVLLIVWPDTVIKVVTYIVGVFFIVKGAYQVINYFLVKGQNDFFNNNLLSGIISVLVGFTLLLIGEEIAHVFRVVIGIWLIYESLVRINTSIKLHAVNISAWKYVLILALFMLIVGIFITFYSGAVVTLIGWMMVLAGIVGVVSDTMFIQYVNKMADALTNRNKAE